MTNRITQEAAIEVLQILTAEHSHQDYFMKAELSGHDVGFGVDIHVDKEKWIELGGVHPVRVNKVPVCIILHG